MRRRTGSAGGHGINNRLQWGEKSITLISTDTVCQLEKCAFSLEINILARFVVAFELWQLPCSL